MSVRRSILSVSGGLAAALWTAEARAGMPSPVLTDWAEIRFETISFFVVVILLSAAVICWLWNSLAKDFTALPRLRYRRALAMVVLLGLFLALVLTMIAGARELLTPGAWQKQGLLYKVVAPAKPADTPKPPDPPYLAARKGPLSTPARFAERPSGRLPRSTAAVSPPPRTPAAIDGKLWQWPGRPLKKGTGSETGTENRRKNNGGEVPVPFFTGAGVAGKRYLYVPGQRIDQKARRRVRRGCCSTSPMSTTAIGWCCAADGTIVSLPASELDQQLSEKP